VDRCRTDAGAEPSPDPAPVHPARLIRRRADDNPSIQPVRLACDRSTNGSASTRNLTADAGSASKLDHSVA